MKKLIVSKETLQHITGGMLGGGGFTVGFCQTRDFACTEKNSDICSNLYTCVSCAMVSCEIKCIPQSTFCGARF